MLIDFFSFICKKPFQLMLCVHPTTHKRKTLKIIISKLKYCRYCIELNKEGYVLICLLFYG